MNLHERVKYMKILLINGSPNENGCTYTALREAEKALNDQGAKTELLQIGRGPVRGCIACGGCRKAGRCVFDDDMANEIADRIAGADGVIIGTPVYFAGANGALCALLDRVFYFSGRRFAGKPGAAVVSCRRGGASSAFDRINKYFTISQMPIVSSVYWNSVHGFTPEDVKKDREGLQVMRYLAYNMVWLIRGVSGTSPAVTENKREFTSFADGK